MSSAESLREFISERLTAAAEEIFSEFERTIVRYEEEIERQRRLLDITGKPGAPGAPRDAAGTGKPGADVLQHSLCKEEEDLTDQSCNREETSSLDQVEPEPPQIKEEQEDFVLKEEIDTFMVTPVYEESDHSEPEPYLNSQLLSEISTEAENPDQDASGHEDLQTSENTEMTPKKKCHRSHHKKVTGDIQCSPDAGDSSVKCEVCERTFKHISEMKRHYRIHTDMPKSNAERQREYRARRNASPNRREEYLRKERIRWKKDVEAGKKKFIDDLSERAKRSKRKAWRKAKERQKRRAEIKNREPADLTPPHTQESSLPQTSRSDACTMPE
ncbi:uncharacterized protein LOC133457029 isoform X2 [Cololabis saira]|uniref:uncharacterized protein LOC133457029 isoform X2 n=1 Tax=Cololabis saira TaxID=129043 RepID=UPI002AD5B2B4|nr:uncharacterized protein LOC133457029 isoform X2 [Cololabis saira]